MHCVERGELFKALRGFFTTSTETTARLAEQHVRDLMGAQIAMLREQMDAMQAQIDGCAP